MVVSPVQNEPSGVATERPCVWWMLGLLDSNRGGGGVGVAGSVEGGLERCRGHVGEVAVEVFVVVPVNPGEGGGDPSDIFLQGNTEVLHDSWAASRDSTVSAEHAQATGVQSSVSGSADGVEEFDRDRDMRLVERVGGVVESEPV